jgi:single-strand DNA-binding protein
MLSIANKVTLIGNLGKDPEVTYMDNGRAKATFSFATNETWKDREGKKQTHPEWHSIVVWDKKAETIEKYCHKGTRLLLEGKLRTSSWTDKNGVTKSKTEVLVEEFVFMDRVSDKGEHPAVPGEDDSSVDI